MRPVEILDDLYFIERGYLNANHFVFISDQPVLIDTAYLSDVDQTLQMIADLGINVADTRLIINTHCHCDHIGGNKLIQDKSGCDIAVHKIGKYFIDAQIHRRGGVFCAADGHHLVSGDRRSLL